jgi:hypothetical protein
MVQIGSADIKILTILNKSIFCRASAPTYRDWALYNFGIAESGDPPKSSHPHALLRSLRLRKGDFE